MKIEWWGRTGKTEDQEDRTPLVHMRTQTLNKGIRVLPRRELAHGGAQEVQETPLPALKSET